MIEKHLPYIPPDAGQAADIESASAHPLLLSIETTGLSPSNAFVFMFTCAHPEEHHWVRDIYIAENRREERQLLLALRSLSLGADSLFFFGYHTFGRRFLDERWENLSSGEHSFFPPDLSVLDIQHRLRSIRAILPLSGYSRRELELRCACSRKAFLQGKKAADHYQQYLKEPSDEILNTLLLHQQEDIDSLFIMNSLDAFSRFADGGFTVTDHAITGEPESLMIECRADRPFPFPVRTKNDMREILLEGSHIRIHVPLYRGTMKYFFPGPVKDYYYLPDEDRAIHKSVAVFVDRTHRVKATRANCYTPAEGDFIPCPGTDEKEVFYVSYGDKTPYIRYDRQNWLEHPTLALKYTRMIVNHTS